jgi:hypothetical protein
MKGKISRRQVSVIRAEDYHKYCFATASGLRELSHGYIFLRILTWFFIDTGDWRAKCLCIEAEFVGRIFILGLTDLCIVGCTINTDWY